jgi:pimeloyl-ACP methyl ester carboxylesterase
MERLQLQYLFEDQPLAQEITPPDYDTFEFVSEGCRLFGEIMWPAGCYTSRPCVVLMHGYPGSARNDDLAHALCRIGCVVVTPHHRGAWGSEGKYLPSRCVEDAVNLANYVRSAAFVQKYQTDPDAVFLAGHSMGGNTTLNAGKQLPWLRGMILIAPFDPTRSLRDGDETALRELLPQCSVLHCDGEEAIYEDLTAHVNAFAFENAFEQVKDRNLCCVGGSMDACAPPDVMFGPLWQRLQQHPTAAIQRFEKLPAYHGLLGCRQACIRMIAQFIADTLI